MNRIHRLYISALWLAFLLTAATKRLIQHFPPPEAEINGDAFWVYLPNARKLAEHPWEFLTTDPASYYVAPLGYIWAAVWNADPASIQFANCILFLLCVLLMWRCAVLLGGILAGIAATSLLAFFPEIIAYIPQVLTETLYLFGLMLCTTSIIEYTLKNQRPRTTLIFFSMGLTITLLSRPVLQFFTLGALLLALAFTIFCTRQVPHPSTVIAKFSQRINGRFCIALLIALMLPAAVAVKNGMYFGVWGLGTGAGSGLYYGLSPFKMGLEPLYSGFRYDAGITPSTVSPQTQGNPLNKTADKINARVAIDILKNTSPHDNVVFFFGKLKAWLFYSTPELRIAPKLRTLRTFELMAILLAALALSARALRSPGRSMPQLPGTTGADGEKLVVLLFLALLVLGMVLQLAPVLYNTRYNLFFLEPWLMLLCGVSIAILLQKPIKQHYTEKTGTAFQWLKWTSQRILIGLLLAAVPPAITRYAARHETLSMDPYRPGPVQIVLDRDTMGPMRAINATPLQTEKWRLESSPATLVIPLRIPDAASLAPQNMLDAIWRLRFAISSPEMSHACRRAKMQLSNGHEPVGWYTPEPLLPLHLDGAPHTYAFQGNDILRPAGDGELSISFNCPPGTIITWYGAELLRSTLPEAARALIQHGVPIDPYFRRDPR